MAQCVAMVGGGLGSFMGKVHRQAIEKAGNLKITCGAFGSTRQSSVDCQDVLEFITGYQITEVCANARSCVPGRLI